MNGRPWSAEDTATPFSGKRVLIAGAAGLIGTNLAAKLASMGADLRLTWHQSQLQRTFTGADIRHADLTKAEDCANVCHGIDTVFLCAAYSTGAAEITQKPLAHVTSNVILNALMLEAARRAGVRTFVFVSSCVGYPQHDRPVREDWMWRDHPPPVYFHAGHMKRYGELLCRGYAEYIDPPMRCVVVRPSNVYGPHDKFDFAKCHVVPALIRRVVERHNPFEVWGDGEDLRDLLYVDDCVDGMLAAAATDKPFLTVNLCAGETQSVRQVLDRLFDIEDFHPTVQFDASKPQTIRARRVDGGLAYRTLGFWPQVPLYEGLRRTIDWYRSVT